MSLSQENHSLVGVLNQCPLVDPGLRTLAETVDSLRSYYLGSAGVQEQLDCVSAKVLKAYLKPWIGLLLGSTIGYACMKSSDNSTLPYAAAFAFAFSMVGLLGGYGCMIQDAALIEKALTKPNLRRGVVGKIVRRTISSGLQSA